jgi:hypothetical protein
MSRWRGASPLVIFSNVPSAMVSRSQALDADRLEIGQHAASQRWSTYGMPARYFLGDDLTCLALVRQQDGAAVGRMYFIASWYISIVFQGRCGSCSRPDEVRHLRFQYPSGGRNELRLQHLTIVTDITTLLVRVEPRSANGPEVQSGT